MANKESSLPAGRSPLRAHLSRHQQSPSSAASAHLRHLHQVATWASLLVPPLGAFLGSRLASTSEILGCPPPSSPNFTCQRCESILHVGINCSVRVRTRKSKKRGTVTEGVSAPINSFIYSCQHCAFKSVMSGTSKAYVKTKLSEVAARYKLSEPYQSLDVCMAEKVTKPVKVSSSGILSSPTFLTESPVSTSKKTRRKGWVSLKQLSASSTDLSPAGSRPVFSPRSAKIPLFPQLIRLDSSRIMPTVSQVDLKCLIPTSSIEGEFGIKTMLELERSEGDIGSEKMVRINADLSKLEQSIAFTAHVGHSNGDTKSLHVPQSKVSDSSGVVATSLWSDAEVIIPISSNAGESICLQKPPANTADLLQQSDASGITMNVEDGLQQKLSIHHTDADAATLEQFAVLSSVLNCRLQDTISTCEAQSNLSCEVSRTDSVIVAPTSSLQGLETNDDVTFDSNFVKSVVDASLPLIVKNIVNHFDEKALDFPVNDKEVATNKIVRLNSSIAKAVQLKKRQRDDDNNWCNVPRKQENCKPEADRLRLGELDIKQTSGMMLVGLSGSVCKNINTQTLAHERKVKPRRKKKPLFKRVGRQWFTICKSSRTLKWRII